MRYYVHMWPVEYNWHESVPTIVHWKSSIHRGLLTQRGIDGILTTRLFQVDSMLFPHINNDIVAKVSQLLCMYYALHTNNYKPCCNLIYTYVCIVYVELGKKLNFHFFRKIDLKQSTWSFATWGKLSMLRLGVRKANIDCSCNTGLTNCVGKAYLLLGTLGTLGWISSAPAYWRWKLFLSGKNTTLNYTRTTMGGTSRIFRPDEDIATEVRNKPFKVMLKSAVA